MSALVLVATDLSDASDEAVRQAHALALSMGSARLAAVYVVPRAATGGLDPLFPPAALAESLAVPELEMRALGAVGERIRLLTGREMASGDLFVRVGPADQEIVAAARELEADVLVVGSHGRTGLARMLLGSVAEKIARTAPCDVMIARQVPSTSGASAKGPVVVAADLSEQSDAVLTKGVREATARETRLFVVHSIEDPHVAAYAELAAAFGATSLGPPPEFEREVEGALSALVARKLGGSSIIAEPVVLTGSAASALVKLTEDVHASVIVVGAGTKSTLERFALGSVADKIVRHAHCSVFVSRR